MLLTNYVSLKVYENIVECGDYSSAITTLESIYVKVPNEIFSRHLLATRRQGPSEPLDDFIASLKTLSKDCNFKSVSASTYREELIRDSFISGLRSTVIRQRLLENKTLTLESAIDQARALNSAITNSETYSTSDFPHVAAIKQDHRDHSVIDEANCASSASFKNSKCFFCGNSRHPRVKCPARDAMCHQCQKRDTSQKCVE